jgi:hypothetical protein
VANIFSFAFASRSPNLNMNVCNCYQTARCHNSLYCLPKKGIVCVSAAFFLATCAPQPLVLVALWQTDVTARDPQAGEPLSKGPEKRNAACIFYKTRRNISLVLPAHMPGGGGGGEHQYTWVQTQLTTASAPNVSERNSQKYFLSHVLWVTSTLPHAFKPQSLIN